jgi:hypothetical protein
VLVIEPDAELAEQALNLNRRLKHSDLVIESDAAKLIDQPRLLDGLSAPYQIAKHGPSCQIAASYFAKVERLLLARDLDSLLLQLKVRPELEVLFDQTALEGVRATFAHETVSIKTLQRVFASSATLSQERKIWKILEELVV